MKLTPLVRKSERLEITAISRSHAWNLEGDCQYPPRKKIGYTSCAWLLCDLLLWCTQR
ncbi:MULTISPECIES: AlpA family phage regulatory protein [Pantoea]|uniref:AlpA family phage regulatory protein n=1 Tax=Pantoea TaxID=53335 RepID=UPI002893758B|nr:AlpA family phage regulatory protein [Pantoea sp. UBA5923]